MVAYYIEFHTRKNPERSIHELVDAKDIKSAKKKLARKHKQTSDRSIIIERSNIVGYY